MIGLRAKTQREENPPPFETGLIVPFQTKERDGLNHCTHEATWENHPRQMAINVVALYLIYYCCHCVLLLEMGRGIYSIFCDRWYSDLVALAIVHFDDMILLAVPSQSAKCLLELVYFFGFQLPTSPSQWPYICVDSGSCSPRSNFSYLCLLACYKQHASVSAVRRCLAVLIEVPSNCSLLLFANSSKLLPSVTQQ